MLQFLKSKIVRKFLVLYFVAAVSAVWGYAAGRSGVFPSSRIKDFYDETYAFLKARGWKYGPEEKGNKFGYSGF